MDFSKLKIEIYDFLGLIVPGLAFICEMWVASTGSVEIVSGVEKISGTSLSLLILASFGLGHLIQELAHVAITRFKGPRFFKSARDKFWVSKESAAIKRAISKEIGFQIEFVDTAFDYCLTKIEGRFAKRDAFITTADLCRSFVVLAFFGIAPAAKMVFSVEQNAIEVVISSAAMILVLLLVGYLSWNRMLRFRELSEVTVFRSYLATVGELPSDAKRE